MLGKYSCPSSELSFPTHAPLVGNMSLDAWQRPVDILAYSNPSVVLLQCNPQVLAVLACLALQAKTVSGESHK